MVTLFYDGDPRKRLNISSNVPGWQNINLTSTEGKDKL
jgi:hypothetical protein